MSFEMVNPRLFLQVAPPLAISRGIDLAQQNNVNVLDQRAGHSFQSGHGRE